MVCHTHAHTHLHMPHPKPKAGHVFLEIFTQLSQVNASGQAPTATAARHNML